MSDNSRRKRCNSCGATVIWARTLYDEPMPVDPGPHPKGNIELFITPGQPEPIAQKVPEEDPDAPRLFHADTRVRYRPHWATCPHSERWRLRLRTRNPAGYSKQKGTAR